MAIAVMEARMSIERKELEGHCRVWAGYLVRDGKVRLGPEGYEANWPKFVPDKYNLPHRAHWRELDAPWEFERVEAAVFLKTGVEDRLTDLDRLLLHRYYEDRPLAQFDLLMPSECWPARLMGSGMDPYRAKLAILEGFFGALEVECVLHPRPPKRPYKVVEL